MGKATLPFASQLSDSFYFILAVASQRELNRSIVTSIDAHGGFIIKPYVAMLVLADKI
jgi:hypothetical protein